MFSSYPFWGMPWFCGPGQDYSRFLQMIDWRKLKNKQRKNRGRGK